MNTPSFEEWHKELVQRIAALGLPELDIDLATLSHLEGTSVEACVQEYAASFGDLVSNEEQSGDE